MMKVFILQISQHLVIFLGIHFEKKAILFFALTNQQF